MAYNDEKAFHTLSPHPVIVTIRDSCNYIRARFYAYIYMHIMCINIYIYVDVSIYIYIYSYGTTITGRGPPNIFIDVGAQSRFYLETWSPRVGLCRV